MVEPCCDVMRGQLTYSCGDHGAECADALIREGSGGSLSLFAANAQYACRFCPWCGAKQPEGVIDQNGEDGVMEDEHPDALPMKWHHEPGDSCDPCLSCGGHPTRKEYPDYCARCKGFGIVPKRSKDGATQ